ncbi:MAG: hypothetical protein M3P01_03580 [Actinomycetota bacterium]|nr:hypothetical protein [Actinomycetota bacterium]
MSVMAKMRWSKLEWQRKSRTHEPLADPHLSVPTERERQKQQSHKKKNKKAQEDGSPIEAASSSQG